MANLHIYIKERPLIYMTNVAINDWNFFVEYYQRIVNNFMYNTCTTPSSVCNLQHLVRTLIASALLLVTFATWLSPPAVATYFIQTDSSELSNTHTRINMLLINLLYLVLHYLFHHCNFSENIVILMMHDCNQLQWFRALR